MFGIGPVAKYTIELTDGWHLVEKQVDDTYYVYDMPENEKEENRFQPILISQDQYNTYYQGYPVQTMEKTIEMLISFLNEIKAIQILEKKEMIDPYLEELTDVEKRTKKNKNNPFLWGHYKKILTILDSYNQVMYSDSKNRSRYDNK